MESSNKRLEEVRAGSIFIEDGPHGKIPYLKVAGVGKEIEGTICEAGVSIHGGMFFWFPVGQIVEVPPFGAAFEITQV